jgi:modulator of FtsH protease HflC
MKAQIRKISQASLHKGQGNNMKFAIPILFALFFLVLGSTYIIDQTQQGVVLQFGKPVRSVNEKRGEGEEPGLHFKLPFFLQDVRIFDKRLLDIRIKPGDLISGDKKNVIVDAFAKYTIVNPLKFYQSVGNINNAQSRLSAILESKLKDAVNNAPLSDLLTPNRVIIMKKIQAAANKEAKDTFGIEVVDVRITRTDLYSSNLESIFNNMKATREAESKKIRAEGYEQNVTIRAEADRTVTEMLASAKREADTIKGQGDALATKVAAESYGRDPEFYKFFRSMQAYREALVSDSTTMLFSSDGEFMSKFKDSGQ